MGQRNGWFFAFAYVSELAEELQLLTNGSAAESDAGGNAGIGGNDDVIGLLSDLIARGADCLHTGVGVLNSQSNMTERSP